MQLYICVWSRLINHAITITLLLSLIGMFVCMNLVTFVVLVVVQYLNSSNKYHLKKIIRISAKLSELYK